MHQGPRHYLSLFCFGFVISLGAFITVIIAFVFPLLCFAVRLLLVGCCWLLLVIPGYCWLLLVVVDRWLLLLDWLLDWLMDWLIDWLIDGWMDGWMDWLIQSCWANSIPTLISWKASNISTLQGTNISFCQSALLKMIFLFPRWDMLVPWRVYWPTQSISLVEWSSIFTDQHFPEKWKNHSPQRSTTCFKAWLAMWLCNSNSLRI